jgi:hypothetical protein
MLQKKKKKARDIPVNTVSADVETRRLANRGIIEPTISEIASRQRIFCKSPVCPALFLASPYPAAPSTNEVDTIGVQ